MKPYPPRSVVFGLLGLALSASIFTACVQEPSKPSDAVTTTSDSTGNLKALAGPSVGAAQWSTVYRPAQNFQVESNKPFVIQSNGVQANSQVTYRLNGDIITRTGTYGTGDSLHHTTAYLQRVDPNSDNFVGWYADLNAARTVGRLGYFAMTRAGKNTNISGNWAGSFNVPNDTPLTKVPVKVLRVGNKMLQENTQLEYKCVIENGQKKIQRFGVIGQYPASGELYETATPNVYAGWFLNADSNGMGVLTLETDCIANKTWMFGWNYLPMASNVSGTFSTDANGIQQGSSLKFTQPANELHRTGVANAAQMLDVNGQGKVFSGWYAQNGQLGAFNVTKATNTNAPAYTVTTGFTPPYPEDTTVYNVSSQGIGIYLADIRKTVSQYESKCNTFSESLASNINDLRGYMKAEKLTLASETGDSCRVLGTYMKEITEVAAQSIALKNKICESRGVRVFVNQDSEIIDLKCL
jgi:hypothetical protein